jgi:hypothetical protein
MLLLWSVSVHVARFKVGAKRMVNVCGRDPSLGVSVTQRKASGGTVT